ncbi:hypothetical protein M9H77_16956 [Catharanthus roseus]|uniref:Uncharacterized protein n=1 Tax=Catharanthus roseus TaxID=4058 RepID=A0ACC0B3L9_CATRO|nr:hypothetical protein M9H77_16956 [Catharanthus roseus]
MTMTQRIMIESPPAANRKQPLMLAKAMGVDNEKKLIRDRDIRHRDRIGEVAGVTTAECAAVCCCCPCAVVNLIVLAVYKVPTGLCKKALKKNKRKRLLGKKKKNSSSVDNNQKTTKKAGGEEEELSSDGEHQDIVGVIDAVDIDSEMWDRFYGAGFWRSASQRED